MHSSRVLGGDGLAFVVRLRFEGLPMLCFMESHFAGLGAELLPVDFCRVILTAMGANLGEAAPVINGTVKGSRL